MVVITDKQAWDQLSNYVIGFIGEVDRSSDSCARAPIGKKENCRFDIENLNMYFKGKQQHALGTFAKDGYMFVDFDGFDKDSVTGQYRDMSNPNAAYNAILGEGVNTILIQSTHGAWNALFKVPKELKLKATEYTSQSTIIYEAKIGTKITVVENDKQRKMIVCGQGIDELPKWLWPTEAVKRGAWENHNRSTLLGAVENAGYQSDKYIRAVLPAYGKKAGLTVEDCAHVYDVIKAYVAPNLITDINYDMGCLDAINKKFDEMTQVNVSVKSSNKTRDYAHEYVETVKPFELIVNSGTTDKELLGLYAFDTTGYKQLNVDTISNWIYDHHPEWNTLKGEAALKYIKRDFVHTKRNKIELNFNKWTPLKNGVLNTETGEFIENGNDCEHNNTIIINHKYIEEYEPDHTSRLIDDFMNVVACDDPEIVQFLWMWLGLCLAKSTTIDKILFMYGSGENLKSYFMSMVENVFPCINRPIKRLGKEFGCQNIDNGYVIYSTEMYEGNMSDLSGDITRQLSSQDTISINGKNVAEYQNRPIGKMMYATNCEVKLGTGKNAKRRTIYIPFKWNANTSRSVNSELLKKCGLTITSLKHWLFTNEHAAEYVLYKAVQGLRYYLNSSRELRYDKPNTLIPQAAIVLTHSFNINNDTVTQWIETEGITLDKLTDTTTHITRRDWYKLYKNWVKDTFAEDDSTTEQVRLNKMIVQEKTFLNQLCSHFNLLPGGASVRIDGKVYRMFKSM